jgi:hypothetical protein
VTGVQTCALPICKIKKDRENRIRIIIIVHVLSGVEAVLAQDLVSPELNDNCTSHVKIQEEIATEGALLERTHYHGRFTEQAYEPNQVCKWTRHVLSSLRP